MWIACEGIDGSGKSTVSVRLARRLRERGLKVLHVRETGRFRSRIASRIRDLNRDAEHASITPEAELLLNAARETQVIAEEIRPALARGEIVITDRGLYSHMVLARSVRALPRLDVHEIAEFAAGGLWPDQVVYFDVDPDIARYRKRLRKIQQKRLGFGSRKSLLGSKLSRLSRMAFHSMASNDPARWHVLDNTWRTLEESETEMMAILAPGLGLAAPPRPSPPRPLLVRPGARFEEWVEHFFEFAAGISRRDPAFAALWVSGLEDRRAAAIRASALEEHPDVVAWSISGSNTPEAWNIRERAVERAAYHVARSLAGLDHEAAWAWRERLAREAPGQVLHALGGLGHPEAHALRRKLWESSPEEGLLSLSGLGDAASWSFRCHELLRGTTPALAQSLEALGSRAAWEFRDRLRGEFPLSVLRSLKGMDDARAWPIREGLRVLAPRAVVETLQGMDGPRANRLRAELLPDLPDEVASSLEGVDTSAAWQSRRRLLESAPVGVLESLRGLQRDPRATDLIREALARSGGRPRIVRKAVALFLGSRANPEVLS